MKVLRLLYILFQTNILLKLLCLPTQQNIDVLSYNVLMKLDHVTKRSPSPFAAWGIGFFLIEVLT